MDYSTSFLSYLLIIGYNQKTIQSKKGHLDHFIRSIYPVNPLAVTDQQIKDYYTFLSIEKANCKAKTINTYMLTIQQFYHWCCLFKHLEKHPLGKLTLLKNETYDSRKPIDIALIHTLYKNCLFPIEKLILIFGYACGCRAGELQQIKVKDLYLEKALVSINAGKFNKKRNIPIPLKHLEYLKKHLLQKNLKHTDYLFSYEGQKMSQYLLRKQLKTMQERIGITPHFTLHHLRHSIASHLVDNGVAIQLVQQFLGHSSLETTQNYVNPLKQLNHENTKRMGRIDP